MEKNKREIPCWTKIACDLGIGDIRICGRQGYLCSECKEAIKLQSKKE